MEGEEVAAGFEVSVAWGASASVPTDDAWLTPAESAVFGGLAVPKRASDWRLGRWIGKETVRLALDAPGLAGADVEILASPGGSPAATVRAPGSWPAVVISLSHAGGMGFAAAAVGTVRLGCDVEAVRVRSDAFVSDYFTAPEAALVRQAPAADQAVLANLIWSAKESALKALGEGLRLDTRAVEVTLVDGVSPEGWRALSVATPTGVALSGHWRVTPGFVWTLVSDAPVTRVVGSPGCGRSG